MACYLEFTTKLNLPDMLSDMPAEFPSGSKMSARSKHLEVCVRSLDAKHKQIEEGHLQTPVGLMIR